MKIKVPPIKSQGIKTKLVPCIKSVVPANFDGLWVEPFMGTGVVAFNIAPNNALLCDINPHLINFYLAIANQEITPVTVRDFLNKEGAKLVATGETHYYKLRDRFNKDHNPLDFLFLNRAGFNGMIRFNRRGRLNTPFCRKPERFSQSYVTKITNQVAYVSRLLKEKNFIFKRQSFNETIAKASVNDIIYCDPPYIDRHADYYGGWDEEQEKQLYRALSQTRGKFILSTWHHNQYRRNEYIDSLWGDFHIMTRQHFYHIGGSEENRNSMTEAIVANYALPRHANVDAKAREQLRVFEEKARYGNER